MPLAHFLSFRLQPTLLTAVLRPSLGTALRIQCHRVVRSPMARYSTAKETESMLVGSLADRTPEDNKETPENGGKTPEKGGEALNGERSVIEEDIKFPWLRANDPPRIKDYPYPPPPPMWSFLSALPFFVQHEFSKWLSSRLLRMNTSETYFPDQFLVGTTLAIRRVLSAITVASASATAPATLSSTESEDSPSTDLSLMLTPALYERLTADLARLPPQTRVRLSLPTIYDATIRDVWITLGPQLAATNPRRFTLMRWMTIQVGMRRPSEDDWVQGGYGAIRGRVERGFMEGVGFKVDVEVDADVAYEVVQVGKEEEEIIVLSDRGRRPLIVRFETPYFEPADSMIDSRSRSDGEFWAVGDDEPRMTWCWKVGDIDYLLEKEELEKREKAERLEEEVEKEKENEE